MKIMNLMEFKNIVANNDFKLLKEKNLIYNDFFSLKYANIYSKYRYGLESYLNKLLNIDELDRDILNSKFNYCKVKLEDKDFYQKFSSLNYVYLRNNLYIERLSGEDLEKIYLLDINNTNDFNELVEIVKRTCLLVISEFLDDNNNRLIPFSRISDDMNMMVNNKTIVYGIRFDEFSNSKELGEKWLDNFFDQHEYLNYLINNKKKEIIKNTGIVVNFMFYNQYNV